MKNVKSFWINHKKIEIMFVWGFIIKLNFSSMIQWINNNKKIIEKEETNSLILPIGKVNLV